MTASSTSPGGEQGPARPRRIIVVDPSLRDNVGHHIEYDLSLLRGAAGEGLEVVVLAHNDAATRLQGIDNIVPVFSDDVWLRWRATTDAEVRRRVLLHHFLLLPMALQLVSTVARRLRGRKLVEAAPPRAARAHASPAVLRAARAAWRRLPGLRSLSFLFLANPRFYFELQSGLRRIGFGEHDLVFCHTATHRQILEWALFATSLPRGPFAQLVLLLRYPPRGFFPALPHVLLAFRLFERAHAAGTLRLATDSVRLARDFAGRTAMPIETLPIPHTAVRAPVAQAGGTPRERLRVASLGNARTEKGIVEILDAVRLINERYARHDEIEFFLQLNDPDATCMARIRTFLEAPPSNVRFTQGALSSPEYQRLLASVDVVLAPYWGEVYASRTSGVFLEAVAAAKPVVTTADTWMAEELAEHGAGVAIPSRSAEALADAIASIHERFEFYRDRALARAPEYARRHSAAAVLRQLARLPASNALQTCASF